MHYLQPGPNTRCSPLISAANLSIQFGAKPLFENVSVTFGNGNRYGLIGANGCGKSTLMKILAGQLEPSVGNVSVDPNARVGQLSQDQFAYEEYRVLDAVIMGYKRLWEVSQERDRLYSLPEMSDEEGMLVADLEVEFAELDGYSAESRAGELLENIGIPVEQHHGPMSAIAPGWKLRVLLAQALFSDPDVLLLDEPTNNLDINTIRWLEGVLNERNRPHPVPGSSRRSNLKTLSRPVASVRIFVSSKTNPCVVSPLRQLESARDLTKVHYSKILT